MKSYEALHKQREALRQEISDNLDFLMGSVSTKGPKRPGPYLLLMSSSSSRKCLWSRVSLKMAFRSIPRAVT